MKTILIIVVLFLSSCVSLVEKDLSKKLYIGMPRQQIIDEFGKPDSISKSSDFEYLTFAVINAHYKYDFFTIVIKNNKVIKYGKSDKIKIQ